MLACVTLYHSPVSSSSCGVIQVFHNSSPAVFKEGDSVSLVPSSRHGGALVK